MSASLPCPSGQNPVQIRILEVLLEQNQLLSDLNGRLEALTAAVLALRLP